MTASSEPRNQHADAFDVPEPEPPAVELLDDERPIDDAMIATDLLGDVDPETPVADALDQRRVVDLDDDDHDR